MFRVRNLVITLALAILLTGCYEVDDLTIRLNEDFSSSVEARIINGNYDQKDVNWLRNCDYQVQGNLNEEKITAFTVTKNFANISDLNSAFECLNRTDIDFWQLFDFKANIKENFLQTDYRLQFIAPSTKLYNKINKNLEELDLNFLLFTSTNKVRLTLPGKIKNFGSYETSFINGDIYDRSKTVNLKKAKYPRTVEWIIKPDYQFLSTWSKEKLIEYFSMDDKLSKKEMISEIISNAKDANITYLENQLILEANSTVSKIDYKWAVTTLIAILTLAFGAGILKRNS